MSNARYGLLLPDGRTEEQLSAKQLRLLELSNRAHRRSVLNRKLSAKDRNTLWVPLEERVSRLDGMIQRGSDLPPERKDRPRRSQGTPASKVTDRHADLHCDDRRAQTTNLSEGDDSRNPEAKCRSCPGAESPGGRRPNSVAPLHKSTRRQFGRGRSSRRYLSSSVDNRRIQQGSENRMQVRESRVSNAARAPSCTGDDFSDSLRTAEAPQPRSRNSRRTRIRDPYRNTTRGTANHGSVQTFA